MDTENTNWYDYYFNRTENILMSSSGQWLAFLDMASRLYDYPFLEQLSVYFQCPHATKLDTYEGWKEKGRQVRKYERSIGVLRYNRVKNLFDISSTVSVDKNKDLENNEQWSITPDDYSIITKKLPGKSKNLKDALENETKRLLFRADMDVDSFREKSVEYMLDRRLGTSFFNIDENSFDSIPEEKAEFIKAAATISDTAGEILKNIEGIIEEQRENESLQQIKRLTGLQQGESEQNERDREAVSGNSVQAGGRLPDTGHIPETRRDGGTGDLREDKVELPSGEQADVLHTALQNGEDNKPPERDTVAGTEEGGRAGDADDEKRTGEQYTEEQQSDGMGEEHQQHNIPGEGDGDKGDNAKLGLPSFSSRNFATINVSELDSYPDGIKDIFGTFNTTPDFYYSTDGLYAGDTFDYNGFTALVTKTDARSGIVEFSMNNEKHRMTAKSVASITKKDLYPPKRYRPMRMDPDIPVWFLYDSKTGRPYVSNEKLMLWNNQYSINAFCDTMNNNSEYIEREQRHAFLEELRSQKEVDLRQLTGGDYAVFGPQARFISSMSDFKDVAAIDLRNIQEEPASADMLTVPSARAELFRKTMRGAKLKLAEKPGDLSIAQDVPYIICLHSSLYSVKDNSAYLLSDFDSIVSENAQSAFDFLLVMPDGQIYKDSLQEHTGSLMDFFWSKDVYKDIAYRLETTAVLQRHDEVLMKGNYNPDERITNAFRTQIVSMKVKYKDGGYKMVGLIADRLSEGDLLLRDFRSDLSKAVDYVVENRQDVTGYRKAPVLEVPETDENLKDVTFFRVGDYYEVYDDEAVYAADKLKLTLMYKEYDQSYRLMAGLSCNALGRDNIKTLIDSGVNVNVIEYGFTTTKRTKEELRDGDLVQSAVSVYLVSKDSETGDISFTNIDRETGRKREDASIPERLYSLPYYSVFSDPEMPEEKEEVRSEESIKQAGADPKEIYRRNAEAIKLLNALRQENRRPSEGEREILLSYEGFGDIPEISDTSDDEWKDERKELRTLLSENDYNLLWSAPDDESYYSPEAAEALYKAVDKAGFRNGNVLIPSGNAGKYLSALSVHLKGSNVYGLASDKTASEIAKILYPDFVILNKRIENTAFTNNTFDIVIGSVPGRDHRYYDSSYHGLSFSYSDYCIAKSLDKVRPGGIAALAIPQSFMDGEDSRARNYIAERADLTGAVRLPEETGCDLIFLQKRDNLRIITRQNAPVWTKTENGRNMYFSENAEMVTDDGTDIASALDRCIDTMDAQITETELASEGDLSETAIPSDPDVRNYSYTIKNDGIYYKENSVMRKVNAPPAKAERIKGLVKIRDLTRDLIEKQSRNTDDSAIEEVQGQLNEAYDTFIEKYGYITGRANKLAMQDDSSYPLLCSLEKTDEENVYQGKADMFYKRTISVNETPKKADTFAQAVSVSLSEKGRVDLEYMAELCQSTAEEMLKNNNGIIFKNPQTDMWETSDEYLSGNVRQKLKIAEIFAEKNDEFRANVSALKAVQPKDLTADEISVKLGATWIEPKYINAFMKEVLGASGLHSAYYTDVTGRWNISNKNSVWLFWDNSYIREIYGTKDANALELLEDALNLHETTILKKDKEGKYYTDEKATRDAYIKQEMLKNKFSDWIFSDITRRDELCKVYNEKFNCIRPRVYDPSVLTFPGINPEITLKDYQKEGAARIIFGGNTMLAHAVGAGKTFEMAAAAMEGKRMGLFHKSLFVVPNHITEQWGSEFMRLYPSANILVATKKDFEAKNRQKFCARIATGDWDAVIIGQTQFEKIPLSNRNRTRFLQQELRDIREAIDSSQYSKCTKMLEKEQRKVIKKIKELAESEKDDVINFEELGVDKLFIDESQNYKNLYIYSKMSNVAGIPHESAKKATDLLLKCKYMDALTGNRGTVFATGTPVSNNMAELYNIMKYLQYDTLKKLNLINFDSWASVFTDAERSAELKPEGNGFQLKTRLKYHNIPELMTIFRDCADIKTEDVLNLPGPEAEYHNEITKPTQFQEDSIKHLAERAEDVRRGSVKPALDNMLLITTDGRRLALDQRLYDPFADRGENTKADKCTENVARIYNEYSSTRSAQLVFCDISTPKYDGSFSIYDELKTILIKKGIPENEIAFIHDAKTETKKAELFAKVRSGNVRVLIGSTAKMGEGTNVQDRLVALHHLDVPWRPADIEQQEGRILRFGNMHEKVHIYRYITEGTFDGYSWQLLEQKQRFISQIMTSKSPVRSADDIDDTVLTYAEVKALAAGEPIIKEKTELDMKINMLQAMKSEYYKQKFALENAIYKELPLKISEQSEILGKLEKDSEKLESHKNKDFTMSVQGSTFNDSTEAFRAIAEAFKESGEEINSTKIGEYCGFDIKAVYNPSKKERTLIFSGETDHSMSLGAGAEGSAKRMAFLFDSLENELAAARENLEVLEGQMAQSKEDVLKPFMYEEDLRNAKERLYEIEEEMNSMEVIPKEDKDKTAVQDNTLSDMKEYSRITEDLFAVKDARTFEDSFHNGAEYIRTIVELKPDDNTLRRFADSGIDTRGRIVMTMTDKDSTIYFDTADKFGNITYSEDIRADKILDSDEYALSQNILQGTIDNFRQALSEIDLSLVRQVKTKLSEHYARLYNSEEETPDYYKAMDTGDEFIRNNHVFIGQLIKMRDYDPVSSDREVAALGFALEETGLVPAFSQQAKDDAFLISEDMLRGGKSEVYSIVHSYRGKDTDLDYAARVYLPADPKLYKRLEESGLRRKPSADDSFYIETDCRNYTFFGIRDKEGENSVLTDGRKFLKPEEIEAANKVAGELIDDTLSREKADVSKKDAPVIEALMSDVKGINEAAAAKLIQLFEDNKKDGWDKGTNRSSVTHMQAAIYKELCKSPEFDKSREKEYIEKAKMAYASIAYSKYGVVTDEKLKMVKDSDVYRYYSTHRPVGAFTFPQGDLKGIVNFENGWIYCAEIGRRAWGYVEYNSAISEQEAENYELVKGFEKGEVVECRDENGEYMTKVMKEERQPNSLGSLIEQAKESMHNEKKKTKSKTQDKSI